MQPLFMVVTEHQPEHHNNIIINININNKKCASKVFSKTGPHHWTTVSIVADKAKQWLELDLIKIIGFCASGNVSFLVLVVVTDYLNISPCYATSLWCPWMLLCSGLTLTPDWGRVSSQGPIIGGGPLGRVIGAISAALRQGRCRPHSIALPQTLHLIWWLFMHILLIRCLKSAPIV